MAGEYRFPKVLAIAALCGLWVLAGAGSISAQEFEAGLLDVSQGGAGDWHEVRFNRQFSSVPVVVLGPLSANHAHGATLRVRGVATTGFEFQVDEWDYLDGAHPVEQISFLALEEGNHNIGGLRWEAARLPGVNRGGTAASFQASFTSAPLVLAQIEGEANAHALSARVRGVDPGGFEALVQSEEAGAALTLADEMLGTIAVETGSGALGDLAFEVAIAAARVRRAWTPVAFQAPSPHPVLLAAMQSVDDPDPAVLRMRALSPGGVEFRADEEQSADSERGHPGEQVGYLAIAGQVVQGGEADARIEFGDVSAAQTAAGIWQAVSFAGDYQYQRPVLITGPLTYNNGAPAGVRVRDVGAAGFEFMIEEWDYLAPGRHPEETFSFLVMEDGTYEIGGLRIEAGRAGQTATSDATHHFTQEFRAVPVLLPQLASDLDPAAATARASAVSQSNFEIRIGEEEAADGVHAPEEVHFLAIEPGAGAFSDGTRFAAGPGARRHGGGWRQLEFGGNFLEPFLFAAAQSDREPDPFHLRLRDLGGFGTRLRLREEASLDSEIAHAGEDLGFLVLQGGSDRDGDGLPDGWELANGLDPDDPSDAPDDQDADGLSALEEFRSNADPHRADTDGDGLLDAYEARAGTLANRGARAPYKPKPKTGLTVFTPEPRPFDPAP